MLSQTATPVPVASPTTIGRVRNTSASEVRSATITAGYAVTPGTMGAHPGVASAWVNFNSIPATLVVNNSYNVSSVTDNGVGNFTVNFQNAFINTNYAVAGSVSQYGADSLMGIGWNGSGAYTTTAFNALIRYGLGTGAYDRDSINLTFFGS